MQQWTCQQCGRKRKSEVIRLPFHCVRSCGHIDTDGATVIDVETGNPVIPTIAQKAKRYSASTVKWIAAGCPMRTDEQVDTIFATCQSCEWFKNGTCSHKLCGCHVRSSAGETVSILGITVRAGFANNKLRRATEPCPIGKW